jgi:hypothetical protein
MVDQETKTKLLEELEKDGNVYRACAKVGIGTSTFYRWKSDKAFWKQAQATIKLGRENACYIGEHSLLSLVKEKDLGAIKYLLGHNSPIYKPRAVSKVILEHHRKLQKSDLPPPISLEDIIDEMGRREEEEPVSLPPYPLYPAVQNAVGTPIVLSDQSEDKKGSELPKKHVPPRRLFSDDEES